MVKKNSSEHFEERIANHTWNTYNTIEDKNRALLELYQDASKSIRNELYYIAEKHSKDGVLSLSDMHKERRLSELNQKYEDIVKVLGINTQKQASNNMQSGFKDVYKNSRDKIGDIDFAMPNIKLMDELLEKPWLGDNFSKRLWKNQKKLAATLNNVLLAGLQQGKTVAEIAVNLNNIMGQGFNAAHRLVRTETMHYLNNAALQGYKDSGVKEVQIWVAIDERACEHCMQHHGKIYDNDKVPILPLHPHCRCTYLPVVEDEESTIKELKLPESAKDIPGITEEMIKSMQSGVDVAEKEYHIKLKDILIEDVSKDFPDTPYLCRYISNKGNHEAVLVFNSGFDFSDMDYVIETAYKQGYFAGKSVEDHMMHEMAHVMTGQHCSTEKEFRTFLIDVENEYVSGVSGYSDDSQDGFETIAEAFVKMRNGEEVPEKARALVEKHIMRWKR